MSYNLQAITRAWVAKLADAQDSGSCEQYAHVGSSPVPRTTAPRTSGSCLLLHLTSPLRVAKMQDVHSLLVFRFAAKLSPVHSFLLRGINFAEVLFLWRIRSRRDLNGRKRQQSIRIVAPPRRDSADNATLHGRFPPRRDSADNATLHGRFVILCRARNYYRLSSGASPVPRTRPE